MLFILFFFFFLSGENYMNGTLIHAMEMVILPRNSKQLGPPVQVIGLANCRLGFSRDVNKLIFIHICN